MTDFDQFARNVKLDTTKSVRQASINVWNARQRTLPSLFHDLEAARICAASIKDYVLDNLSDLLVQFENGCVRNGIQVHWAKDASEARSIVTDICKSKAHPGAVIVKAKSMVTEEIHLNAALESEGYEVVETDLGEFVVQLDNDTPSHIVAPIVHKNRRDVAKTFFESGIGPYSEVPETLALQARAHLREKFKQAEVGISGVNFGIAESGRIVIVENEGNNRLSTTAPKTHIAVMGIEKLLPRDSDLPLFLKLLAGSATGQRLTVYTHLISRPRKPGEVDGPDHVHIVLLDNGRSKVASGPYKAILRCIRCGACLNTCPVYRQSGGHAYGNVYSGPIGAVLAPAKDGISEFGHLAKASTLCGECEEVCPVAIPIPSMLLQLRDEYVRTQPISSTLQWKGFAMLSTSHWRWLRTLQMVPIAAAAPNPWTEFHSRPQRMGRDFRRWFRDRT